MFVGQPSRARCPHGVGEHGRPRRAARWPGCSACSSRCGCSLPAIAEVPDWPARQARTSAIARAIDELFPTPPDAVDAIRQLVGDALPPRCSRALQPAPDVPAPPRVDRRGVDVARPGDASTVKVEARLRAHPGGQRVRRRRRASSSRTPTWSPGRARRVRASATDGRGCDATVVAFDPIRDLAAAAGRPASTAPPLPLGDAIGRRPGGGLRPSRRRRRSRSRPFRVGERGRRPTGKDIYDRRPVDRARRARAVRRARAGRLGSRARRRDGRVGRRGVRHRARTDRRRPTRSTTRRAASRS